MLIADDVRKLCQHYEEHLSFIREFIADVLRFVEANGADEVWVESYKAIKDREASIATTILKEGRMGPMVWVSAFPEFEHVLAFLRHPSVDCRRVPNPSIFRIDGIQFVSADIEKLRKLSTLLGE